MQTFDSPEAQALLTDVVHDLRQPLSTIETSAFILNLLLRDGPVGAHEQLRIIQRQVAIAAGILHKASAQLRHASQEPEPARLEFTNSQTAVVT